MNSLNLTQTNSNTNTVNSTEITEETKTPTKNVTSSLALLPLSETINNSGVFIADGRQKQIVLLPKISIQRIATNPQEKQFQSQNLFHRLAQKVSNVSNTLHMLVMHICSFEL